MDRWAEALTLIEEHGDEVVAFLNEQAGQLARAGDLAGIRRLRDIAGRVNQLTRPEATGQETLN